MVIKRTAGIATGMTGTNKRMAYGAMRQNGFQLYNWEATIIRQFPHKHDQKITNLIIGLLGEKCLLTWGGALKIDIQTLRQCINKMGT